MSVSWYRDSSYHRDSRSSPHSISRWLHHCCEFRRRLNPPTTSCLKGKGCRIGIGGAGCRHVEDRAAGQEGLHRRLDVLGFLEYRLFWFGAEQRIAHFREAQPRIHIGGHFVLGGRNELAQERL